MNRRNINLYLPVLTIGFILSCALSIIKVKALGETAKKTKALEGMIANTVFISPAKAEAMREKRRSLEGAMDDKALQGEAQSLREAVKETQALLRKNGIRSSRFRITGDAAEFAMRCSPQAFFTILLESSLNIIYLNVKPEKDDPPEVSVIMRIQDET